MRAVGHILLTIRICRDDDGYSAVCEELGVSTCGDSLDGLMTELQAMVSQHLNALEHNGVRAAFFHKHGIRVIKGTPSKSPRSVQLSVRPGEMVTRMTESLPALV